jgi:hypothetical protein
VGPRRRAARDHAPLFTRDVAPRAVRALVHAALIALVTTWLVAPERSGPLFGGLGAGLVALSVPLAFVAHLRPAFARGLERARRGLDLATLAFVLAFGLAEVELRLLARSVASPLLAPPDARADEVIRTFRLAPGQRTRGTVANADGFLDGPFTRARRAGVRRVVALGDSFAVGVVAYRDNFLTRLDELLDHPGAQPTEMPGAIAPVDDVEVLNFGVVSTSPREYLHLWRTEASHFEPDLALLCFFTGNDWGVSRGASLLRADSTFLVTFLARCATLAREHRASAKTGAPPAAPATDGTIEALPTLSPDALARVERGSLEIARRAPTRATAEKFAETFALFETIVAEIGPRLRVAILPDQLQVDDALFRELAGGDAASFDRDLPSRRLAEWLAARGVRHLDLLPALRAAQQGGATYRSGDTHWNERGNAAAAAALAEWLAPDLK